MQTYLQYFRPIFMGGGKTLIINNLTLNTPQNTDLFDYSQHTPLTAELIISGSYALSNH